MNEFEYNYEDLDVSMEHLHNSICRLKSDAQNAISDYHFILNLLGASDRESAAKAILELNHRATVLSTARWPKDDTPQKASVEGNYKSNGTYREAAGIQL